MFAKFATTSHASPALYFQTLCIQYNTNTATLKIFKVIIATVSGI
jgi:hypothetical protein